MTFTKPRRNAMPDPILIVPSESEPSSKHTKLSPRGSAWLNKLHGHFKNEDAPDTVQSFSTTSPPSPHPDGPHQQPEEHQDIDVKDIAGTNEQPGFLIHSTVPPSPKLKFVAVAKWVKARQAYLRVAKRNLYDQARVIMASRRISRLRDTPAGTGARTDIDGCLDIPFPTGTSNQQTEHSSHTSTEDHSQLSEGAMELPAPPEPSSSDYHPNRHSIRLVLDEDTKDGDNASLDCDDFATGLSSLPSPPISESDDFDDSEEVFHVLTARPPSFITNRHCIPRSEREGAPSPVDWLEDSHEVGPPLPLFSQHLNRESDTRG